MKGTLAALAGTDWKDNVYAKPKEGITSIDPMEI
jgi:hypothetical protein